MLKFNLHTLVPRLLAFVGSVIGKIFTFCGKRNTHKDPKRPYKATSGFFMGSHYISPTPLAESDNCVACDREVSLTTLFNSSGVVGWYHAKVLWHKKNIQMMEWTKTLSPISLGSLYVSDPKSRDFLGEICVQLQTVKHLFCLKTYATLNRKVKI